MAKFTKEQREESRAFLVAALANAVIDSRGRPIIYTVLRSVSRSGMLRKITPLIIDRTTCKPVSLAFDYERRLGRMADDSMGRWACRVSGCGMDMGWHLAESIAYAAGLTGDGNSFSHEWL